MIFSSELFGGYKVIVNPDEFNRVRDLVEYCQTILAGSLELIHLDFLSARVKKTNFHIHHVSMSDIISKPNEIYYICECSISLLYP